MIVCQVGVLQAAPALIVDGKHQNEALYEPNILTKLGRRGLSIF